METNLAEKKNLILQEIQKKGPSLPGNFTSFLGIDTILLGALFSELVRERRLKFTTLKIGSSPLYYLPEQESKLENFASSLKGKEKEAYELVKKKKVLRDSEQEPAIRVALRSVRDFAVPVKANLKDSEILFWRYFLLGKEETTQKITAMLKIKENKAEKPVKKEERKEKKEEKQEVKKKERKIKEADTAFRNEVIKFLYEHNIRLKDEILVKSKEFRGVIFVRTDLGEIDMLVIAKDKKRANKTDVMKALSMSQQEKMPVLLLADDIAKNCEIELEKGSYVIFKKLC